MSEAELLAYAVQIAYFVAPTLLGAILGYTLGRRGRGAGVGAAAGFVLGATAYGLSAVW